MRKTKCSYFHEVNDSLSFITISLIYEKPSQYYWKLYIFLANLEIDGYLVDPIIHHSNRF